MCNHLLICFRMCFLLPILRGGIDVQEYTVLEINFEKGVLETMEGEKFEIDVFDIPTMAGWCPCEKIACIEVDGRKMLKHYSGTIVKLK